MRASTRRAPRLNCASHVAARADALAAPGMRTDTLPWARAWPMSGLRATLVYRRRGTACAAAPAASAAKAARGDARAATISTAARLPRRGHRARSRGRPPRAATACWCANTNSIVATTCSWTGAPPKDSRTSSASAGSPAGSMMLNARIPSLRPAPAWHGPDRARARALYRHQCLRALAMMPAETPA